ncbi:MAG: ABC transporter ATP-binding protein [Clostridium sp.]|nr:ABC transporter ATP-binding protein [Clostridium sp.]
MKQILLSAKDICKGYGKEKGGALILDHVSADIYRDDFTIIMGPSGAGKSTLLYCLSGMDHISFGKVVYKGKVISHFKEKQMAQIRSREFGFVFQQTHLVSNLTLFENVVVAGYLRKDRTPEETRRRAEALLEQMNVGSARDRMPSEVSGGEAQRAAIARAMIHEPGIIFADEPTGALNKRNTGEVLDRLTELNREGQSILMVTHDLRAAIRGTRILYLEDGKILDELVMPIFHPEDGRTRENTVNNWLASFRW